jgi:hypothetical protein
VEIAQGLGFQRLSSAIAAAVSIRHFIFSGAKARIILKHLRHD